jgi:hypothetical protein
VEVCLYAFLTSALEGDEWSVSRPGRFTPRERAPGTHWIGGWVGPRANLDAVVNTKIRSPYRDSNPRSSSPQPSAIPQLIYLSVLTPAGVWRRIHFLIKHHANKTYWRSGSIAPRILDLSTRWKWVVSFTSLPLYPRINNPPYQLNRRLDEPQIRSGSGGDKKNFQPQPEIEPRSSSP